jgi:hypothetical protein
MDLTVLPASLRGIYDTTSNDTTPSQSSSVMFIEDPNLTATKTTPESQHLKNTKTAMLNHFGEPLQWSEVNSAFVVAKCKAETTNASSSLLVPLRQAPLVLSLDSPIQMHSKLDILYAHQNIDKLFLNVYTLAVDPPFNWDECAKYLLEKSSIVHHSMEEFRHTLDKMKVNGLHLHDHLIMERKIIQWYLNAKS